MSEKIISIREVFNLKWSNGSKRAYRHDGYQIVTDKQEILLMISNEQSCCEEWGYLMSEDDLEQFVGAELIDVTVTDTALKTEILPKMYDISGDVMFVNLETSKGKLQFVAYNDHNGHYGHDAVVVSNQLNLHTGL